MLVENATTPWGQSWEWFLHKHKCIQFIARVLVQNPFPRLSLGEVAFSTSMCIYNVNLKTYPKAFFTMTTLLMSLLENAIFKILKTSYRILNSISVTLLIVLLMRFFYTFVVFTSETLCNLWHGNNNFCKIE